MKECFKIDNSDNDDVDADDHNDANIIKKVTRRFAEDFLVKEKLNESDDEILKKLEEHNFVDLSQIMSVLPKQ